MLPMIVHRVIFLNRNGTPHEVHAVPIGNDAEAYARNWEMRFGRRYNSHVVQAVELGQIGGGVADRSAKEAKKANVEAMGEPLGTIYSELWQIIAVSHFYWNEYLFLYGRGPVAIEFLNKTAPSFFRMVQEELWENSLLQLTRITDPAKSPGKDDRTNLSVQALPELVTEANLKATVKSLVDKAVNETAFARDWRDRHIGHRDLKLALGQDTKPLADASRAQVEGALKTIGDVLNAIEKHYFKSETRFDLGRRRGGAMSLLHVLNVGLKAQEGRDNSLKDGVR